MIPFTASRENTMAAMISGGLSPSVMNARADNRDWERLQFWTIWSICLPACLCAAALARLVPNRTSRRSNRSVFAEAFASAGTTARMAFCG